MPAGSQCEKRIGTLRVNAALGGTKRSSRMGLAPSIFATSKAAFSGAFTLSFRPDSRLHK
jgi:hypothetical protein